ncbi:MAG: AbrB/MazE/SpoVT family DNA-binding domain-containing protein [Spirochaetes bacterium]|jgi:AbrB family looped-hinge helix DNA binding protein|nr:AbrB/MazE/SpoVT family DNA-binding domain-containing protein [Spirochaetota bacterium]
MNRVTVSTKFQVVIPREVRGKLGIEAGMKFDVIEYGDRIELIPVRDIKSMRGFARGITPAVKRDRDRI